MPSSHGSYTVDGVWCADDFMKEKNSKLKVGYWKGDLSEVYGALDCQVIMRPDEDVIAVAKHYQAISDEDLLVISTDGSVHADRRGGWAAIQSVDGGRHFYFASGSMTKADRPSWARRAPNEGDSVESHEMELRALAGGFAEAAKVVVQRSANGLSTWKTIVALCDSAHALSTLGAYQLKTGQARVDDYCNISILRSVGTLREHGVRCVFDRTKGHAGVASNVAADRLARAQSGCSKWSTVMNWRSAGSGNYIEGLPDSQEAAAALGGTDL
ncbi:hypothetical protein SLS58_005051 [Diplodia intermedia]|uniref:RNase H type-1 domain-containing protein n=1 Tax=Diplodia intermedia TaxID=856260 RepID=A0ABR3TRV8_9PEZI